MGIDVPDCLFLEYGDGATLSTQDFVMNRKRKSRKEFATN